MLYDFDAYFVLASVRCVLAMSWQYFLQLFIFGVAISSTLSAISEWTCLFDQLVLKQEFVACVVTLAMHLVVLAHVWLSSFPLLW